MELSEPKIKWSDEQPWQKTMERSGNAEESGLNRSLTARYQWRH